MADAAHYEGLVHSTARMWHEKAGMEEEDLRQELRMKVVKGLRKYDASRSPLTEEKYIFGIMRNQITDLCEKHKYRSTSGVMAPYTIEEFFDREGAFIKHDGKVENLMVDLRDHFEKLDYVLPDDLTEEERDVLELKMMGYNTVEISENLQLAIWKVKALLKSLKEKLSYLDPKQSNGSSAVAA